MVIRVAVLVIIFLIIFVPSVRILSAYAGVFECCCQIFLLSNRTRPLRPGHGYKTWLVLANVIYS